MDINWNRRKYSEEEFRIAWQSNQSIAGVARALGLNLYGGTYITIKTTAEKLRLDKSHMTGQGWNKGDTFGLAKRNTIPLDDILVEYSTYTNTSKLKDRLWSTGLKERRCEICGLTEWLGKPAPLALDHINGLRRDNRIDNLRILCYNCHGQTQTFCRRKTTAE